MDTSHLSALLGSMSINGLNRDKILDQVKENHFQIACQRHFEITHPNAMSKGINQDGVGNHPNAWTRASMEYHGHAAKAAVKEEGASATAAAVSSSDSGVKMED